jgi:hypothetical protein
VRIQVPLGLHDGGEVVQGGRQPLVLGIGTRLEHRRGPLDQPPAAGQVALVPPQQSQVLHGFHGLRVLGTEYPLRPGQRLLQHGSAEFVLTTRPEVHAGAVEDGDEGDGLDGAGTGQCPDDPRVR